MSSFHGGISLPFAQGDLRVLSTLTGEVCLWVDAPLVSTGDEVASGQPVGTCEGRVVLASLAGTVTEVADGFVKITGDGSTRTVEATPFGVRTGKTLAQATPEELLAEIRSAGIVEADGSVLADHLEAALKRSEAGKLRYAAVSLLEPDPASLSLSSLGVEFAHAIAGGLSILLKLLSVREGSILCDKNRPETVEAIRDACEESRLIAVELPEIRYPQAHPKLITRWLCQKELSAKSSPEAAGLFLTDAESCIALHRLFATGIPRLAVRTTLYQNGEGRVYDLPLGLPLSAVTSAGLLAADAPDRLTFGVMNAAPIPELADRSLAVLSADLSEPDDGGECIRCGRCAAACPMFLQPNRYLPEQPWIARLSGAPRDAICCIGCGCCSFVCPSGLPLRRYAAEAHERELLRQRERESATAERGDRR